MQSEKLQRLRECPFCGGEAKVRSFYKDHHVYCTKCFASTIKYSATKEKAIEAWNRRAGYIALEDIVDLDSQTAANNEAMRKVIAFMAGGTEDGK